AFAPRLPRQSSPPRSRPVRSQRDTSLRVRVPPSGQAHENTQLSGSASPGCRSWSSTNSDGREGRRAIRPHRRANRRAACGFPEPAVKAPRPGFRPSPGSPGDITGNFTDARGGNHGFLRTLYGAFTTFDAPGGFGSTFPISINLGGVISGSYGGFSNH